MTMVRAILQDRPDVSGRRGYRAVDPGSAVGFRRDGGAYAIGHIPRRQANNYIRWYTEDRGPANGLSRPRAAGSSVTKYRQMRVFPARDSNEREKADIG